MGIASKNKEMQSSVKLNSNLIDISVVIPIKEEEDILPELSSRLENILTMMKLSYEVIFVTDINKDNTFELLKEIHANNNNFKTIKLSNHSSQHIAVMAGLHVSCGNAVVIMDGDLQDYPEDIVKLYEKYQEGYDIVYGIKERKNDSSLRNFFSKSFKHLINHLSDNKIDFNSNMFRIISRRTVDELSRFNEKEPATTALMSFIGFPTATVLVHSGVRLKGKTKYSYLRQINMAISFILSFSTKPLRIISFIGFIFALLSFFYLVSVVYQKLIYDLDPFGWPTLVVLVTFFGGVQLIALGIIGEYIGRIFMETKDRPLYIVDERVGKLKDINT